MPQSNNPVSRCTETSEADRIYYRGPLQPRGSPPRVKLDLASDERMVEAPVQRQVTHLYTDGIESVMFARCYTLAELLGEKIRALGERARPDVELVRFAAANRLCIDLSYEDTLIRVEPYSVRRTHDDDVVLYACETDSPSYGRYRTEDIQDVEVTSQPFVPRFANELAALDG